MGHLFLEDSYLRAERIVDSDRNTAIADFCSMVTSAIKAQDHFYALQSSYADDGAIIRYFEPWHEFTQRPYGRCISQATYQQLIDLFMGFPNFNCFDDTEEFYALNGNKGEAGFRIPGMPDNVVVDLSTWRAWRKVWYLSHPDDIDWNQAKDQNCFFVNQDAISEILEVEIKHQIADDYKLNDEVAIQKEFDRIKLEDESLHDNCRSSKPLKPNHIALMFHKYVMSTKARGGSRQGYAKDIADQICENNYYHEAHDLSVMEKDAALQNRNDLQRVIYYAKRLDGTFHFISIDFEKGMFEFHADDGSHLGEYHYDGSYNDKADASGCHNLRRVMEWKRKHHYL